MEKLHSWPQWPSIDYHLPAHSLSPLKGSVPLHTQVPRDRPLLPRTSSSPSSSLFFISFFFLPLGSHFPSGFLMPAPRTVDDLAYLLVSRAQQALLTKKILFVGFAVLSLSIFRPLSSYFFLLSFSPFAAGIIRGAMSYYGNWQAIVSLTRRWLTGREAINLDFEARVRVRVHETRGIR